MNDIALFFAGWLALSFAPAIALGKFLKAQHQPIKRLSQREADRFDHMIPVARFSITRGETIQHGGRNTATGTSL
jgi:hypothetical protein